MPLARLRISERSMIRLEGEEYLLAKQASLHKRSIRWDFWLCTLAGRPRNDNEARHVSKSNKTAFERRECRVGVLYTTPNKAHYNLVLLICPALQIVRSAAVLAAPRVPRSGLGDDQQFDRLRRQCRRYADGGAGM
jgi:hypothetical protein